MRRNPPRRPGEETALHQSLHNLVDVVLRLGWIVIVIAIVGDALGALLIALAPFFAPGKEPVHWSMLWWGVGILAAGVLATIGLELQRRRQATERTRESLANQMLASETVGPIVKRLVQLLGKPSTSFDAELAHVIGSVLDADGRIFERIESSRMVVYEYEPARRGRRHRLGPVRAAGKVRKAEPSAFTMRDERGRAALEWATEATEPKFVADVRLEPDPGWRGSGNGYRTFISAPVRANGSLMGMITIDAAEPGDLDETDVPTIALLADLLAVAYSSRP